MEKPLKRSDKFLLLIIPALANLLIRFLGLTMRIETLFEERVEPFWKEDKRMILAFWHGRLLMIPLCYHGEKIHLLISQHKDGQLLARTMEHFGHNSVRGSSTRGGSKAMREMLRLLNDSDIALTPDGPKGPRYCVQDGVVTLARLSGVPVIPVTFAASKKKVFGSWDAFNLPLPFSRGVFVWGEPIYLARNTPPDEGRRLVETSLREITEYADSYVGHS